MIQGLFTLILFKQDSDSVRSPSVFNRIRLSIHHDSNEPANVESCLDKIRVIGSCFRYQGVHRGRLLGSG
jgi:hypothetical protein